MPQRFAVILFGISMMFILGFASSEVAMTMRLTRQRTSYNVQFDTDSLQQFYSCLCDAGQRYCSINVDKRPESMTFAAHLPLFNVSNASYPPNWLTNNYECYMAFSLSDPWSVRCSRLTRSIADKRSHPQCEVFRFNKMPSAKCDFDFVGVLWDMSQSAALTSVNTVMLSHGVCRTRTPSSSPIQTTITTSTDTFPPASNYVEVPLNRDDQGNKSPIVLGVAIAVSILFTVFVVVIVILLWRNGKRSAYLRLFRYLSTETESSGAYEQCVFSISTAHRRASEEFGIVNTHTVSRHSGTCKIPKKYPAIPRPLLQGIQKDLPVYSEPFNPETQWYIPILADSTVLEGETNSPIHPKSLLYGEFDNRPTYSEPIIPEVPAGNDIHPKSPWFSVHNDQPTYSEPILLDVHGNDPLRSDTFVHGNHEVSPIRPVSYCSHISTMAVYNCSEGSTGSGPIVYSVRGHGSVRSKSLDHCIYRDGQVSTKTVIECVQGNNPMASNSALYDDHENISFTLQPDVPDVHKKFSMPPDPVDYGVPVNSHSPSGSAVYGSHEDSHDGSESDTTVNGTLETSHTFRLHPPQHSLLWSRIYDSHEDSSNVSESETTTYCGPENGHNFGLQPPQHDGQGNMPLCSKAVHKTTSSVPRELDLPRTTNTAQENQELSGFASFSLKDGQRKDKKHFYYELEKREDVEN